MDKVLWGITVGFVLLATGAFEADPPARSKDWKLVWRDEFNGRKLDPKKWDVLLREHSKNNELQYYVPDEVYLDNGWLRLRSRERNYGSQRYTSGRLDTALRASLRPRMGDSRFVRACPAARDCGRPPVFPQYHDIDYVRVYQRGSYFQP
jgi:hypothetical protein